MAFGSKVAVALAAAALLSGCGSDVEKPRDTTRDADTTRYIERCRSAGGMLSKDSDGWGDVTYTCVGQTSGVPLPPMTDS